MQVESSMGHSSPRQHAARQRAAVAPEAGRQEGRGAACAHSAVLLLPLLQEETSVPCECNEYIGELLRGVRQHLST